MAAAAAAEADEGGTLLIFAELNQMIVRICSSLLIVLLSVSPQTSIGENLIFDSKASNSRRRNQYSVHQLLRWFFQLTITIQLEAQHWCNVLAGLK